MASDTPGVVDSVGTLHEASTLSPRARLRDRWRTLLDLSEEDCDLLLAPRVLFSGPANPLPGTPTPRVSERIGGSDDECARQLEKIGEFNFDVLKLAKLPVLRDAPLSILTQYVLQKGDFVTEVIGETSLSVAPEVLSSRVGAFLQAVDQSYLDGLYHTRVHGADVMATTHWAYQSEALGMSCSKLDEFISLLAAAIHDIGHPGTNNAFQVKTLSPVSLRYNDVSPLENMHAAMSFELMRRNESCNWLSLLSPSCPSSDSRPFNYQAYVRKAVVSMILATDNAKHFELMTAFSKFLQEYAVPAQVGAQDGCAGASLRGLRDPACLAKKQILLDIVLHAADISNPVKPIEIALPWTRLILEEFWAQGDLEKRLGLDVTFMCDRESGMRSIARGQVGFIQNLVMPLYQSLVVLSPDAFSQAARQGASNKEFWEKKAEEEATYEELFGCQPHAAVL